jgi:hypothetical protein
MISRRIRERCSRDKKGLTDEIKDLFRSCAVNLSCGTVGFHRVSSVSVCALTRRDMQTDGNLPVFFAKRALRAEASGRFSIFFIPAWMRSMSLHAHLHGPTGEIRMNGSF